MSSTRIDTLPTSSRAIRSRRFRDVTYWPSRPAIGDVFTPRTTETVGSSTRILGIGRGLSGSVIVSPIVMSSIPARQMMSPAAAWSTSVRVNPSNMNNFVTRVVSIASFSLQTAIVSPSATRPSKIRPMAIRPR